MADRDKDQVAERPSETREDMRPGRVEERRRVVPPPPPPDRSSEQGTGGADQQKP